MGNANKGINSTKYIIRVKSHLDPLWDDWFEGMAITQTDNGETIISGSVVDQSALHGLLEKIRNLNVQLISVQKADTDKENSGSRVE